jgi:hypothetical protein
MKLSGRAEHGDESESIEFVPKRELDRAQQEVERLRKQSERLQKENERLKEEAERLRRELEAALRVPASVKRRRTHEVNHKPTRSGRAASRAAVTAGSRAVPSPHAWMNESRFHCWSAARIAAAAWNRKAAKRSIRKKLSGEP